MTVSVSVTGRIQVPLRSSMTLQEQRADFSAGGTFSKQLITYCGHFNLGIRSVMTQAAFSFIGTEIVAVSAIKFCQLVLLDIDALD
jgi:amino acid permease